MKGAAHQNSIEKKILDFLWPTPVDLLTHIPTTITYSCNSKKYGKYVDLLRYLYIPSI